MKHYCIHCYHEMPVPASADNPCRYCIDRGNPLYVGNGHWNGDTAVHFTACIVTLSEITDRPMWWQNAFIGKEIQAIEVMGEGVHMMLANHDGSAYHKLTIGRGLPTSVHTAIGAYEFKRFVSDDELMKEVDERVTEQYRDTINEYLKGKDPEAYARLLALEAEQAKFDSMTLQERVEYLRVNMGVNVTASDQSDGSVSGSDSSDNIVRICDKIAFKMKRLTEHKVPVRVSLSIVDKKGKLYRSHSDCPGGYNAAAVNRNILLSAKDRNIDVATATVTQAVPI